MACLSTTRRTQIQALLTKWEARAALADTYYELLFSGEGIESGKFDSGEAMSWWKNTDILKFDQTVARIDQWVAYYSNKLNGTGIVRLNLSRGR